MAISKQSLKVSPDGWAVNATSPNAIDGEELEAAPGAGKILVLQELHLSVSESARAIIDSRASATATVTRLVGPVTLNAATNNAHYQFIRGLRANANEALYVTSSADAFVNVIASGVIL